MRLTVLLDLDNTLLSNEMDQFLPAYLKLLSSYLPQWPAEKVIKELLAGTDQMIKKTMPEHTLAEVFDAAFYPGLNVEKAEVQTQIDRFYREGFPRLQGITAPRPEAQRLVDYLFNHDHKVVIATNPLFPATAIEQRLKWARLPVEKYPFNIVTSYEKFHFCKPHPAYLAEILGQMGWNNEQPAVVVGDGLVEEILPASTLGLPAFWVNDSDLPLPEGLHPLSRKGRMDEILPWIQQIQAMDGLELRPTTAAGITAILKSTPAALDSLTRPLAARVWNTRPSPKEWAMVEIICHLRDVDCEVNLPRFKQVAAGENPFFAGAVTDIWADERAYINENGPKAMHTFMDVRSAMIAMLEGLDQAGWLQPARHAIFGPTNLLELAGFTTTHDRTHVHQAFQLL